METINAAPDVKLAVPDVRLIPLDKIEASRHQARKDFDEEGIRGLAESMKLEKQIQPITVRETGDGFELIAGERRVRAAKLLGWPTIEAKIIKTVSEAEAAVKGLVENLQRQELNPIEEAAGFQEIAQLDPYWTQAKIAQIAGRSQAYVSQSLQLLGLPEDILQIIRALIISRSHGVQLCRVQGEERQIQIVKQIQSDKLSWEQTRKLVDDILNKPAPTTVADPRPATILDPAATLWPLMKSNAALKDTPWKARYQGEGQWSFSVTLPTEKPGPDLARWFGLMQAAAMEAIANTDGRDTLESLIPRTRKDLERAMPDVSRLLLPEGSGAEGRLRQAAELLGPEEVFKQIFGPGALITRKVQGKTWQDLGCSNPNTAVDKLLAGLSNLNG